MKMRKKNFIIILVIVLLLGGGLGYGTAMISGIAGIGQVSIDKSEYNKLTYMNEKYSKLESLWTTVDENFYKKVNDNDIETAIYKGLISGVNDKYSAYMTEKEYDSWMATATGEFEGVGISFAEDKKGNVIVLDVIEDSPAKKAKIKIGDYILKVDGKTYKDINDLGSAIRGNIGTKVKLTMSRNGKEYNKTLTREKITTKTVSSKVISGNIGYIKISSFEDATADDFEEALRNMEVKNTKGLIIDLRNNGGGLVDQATKVADHLMGKGVITYMEDQNGKKKYYKSNKDETDLSYVVLVNGGTASSSEILTAAVKDNTDNKIVGTKTFGKGIVQETQTLKDGSALKLTVMQYFSPKGNIIHKKGIKPNYIVKGEKAQLKKAIEIIDSK